MLFYIFIFTSLLSLLIFLTFPIHLLYNLLTFIQAIKQRRLSLFLKAKLDFLLHFKEVYENRRRKIPTSKLNEVMQEVIEANGPPSIKGKLVKIKYVTQLNTYYPSFAFFCNLPQYVKDPYKRYLENKLREKFNFRGSPIMIYMRKK